MSNCLRVTAISFAFILLAACAPTPQAPADSESPVENAPAQSEPAVAGSINANGLELFGKQVQIPFTYERAYERAKTTADGQEERQLGLLVAGKDHKALAVQLDGALQQAGFHTAVRENKDGWVWITFSDAAGGEAKVAVRPDQSRGGTMVIFKLPKA